MSPLLGLLLALQGSVAEPISRSGPCGSLAFEEAASRVGLSFVHDRGATERKHLPETMGSGLAWLDFDDDGWLDLYVVQSGAFPPDGAERAANRLYRNRGDGTFEDVTERAGVGDRGYGQGVVAADVDGDGRTDLYVTNYGPDVLFLNRGDGRFEDATKKAGLGLDGWSSSAALADADGDGDLDLYVTRYLEYDPDEDIFCGNVATGKRDYCHPHLFRGAHDRFYENAGRGRFSDATEAAGLGHANGKGLGVIFADLDDDGLPDLYVANDTTSNFVFRNRGDGRFEDVSLLSGAGMNRDGQPEAGMGIALGDVDADGDPDLAVTNFDTETNTLYRNLGNLLFEDVSAETGFGLPSFNRLGFGIVMNDLDRDGDPDVYVANGHILEDPARQGVAYAQPDLLLLGTGKSVFESGRCGRAFESAAVGRGVAAGDFDNDGDVDVAVLNSGGPLWLLENTQHGNDWIGLRLRGRAPNTEAIGARVVMETASTRRVQWVLAGDSYQSSSDRRLIFPNAPTDLPGEIRVRWPSGEETGHPIETGQLGRYHELVQPPKPPSSPLRRGPSPRAIQ